MSKENEGLEVVYARMDAPTFVPGLDNIGPVFSPAAGPTNKPVKMTLKDGVVRCVGESKTGKTVVFLVPVNNFRVLLGK